jgi:hypothetical protein
LGKYVDQDRRAEIDWADPQQRQAQLKVLVSDAEAVLELASQQADDEEVRSLGWMLSKILGDDIVVDKQGEPQIGEGTAPDRIVSTTDREMRHGRKSAAHRFNGHKVNVATDESSEMILDIIDLSAASGDGKELLPTIERVETHTGVKVERAIADGAYGSGANRAGCAERQPNPVDLVSALGRPNDPVVDKSAFILDWDRHTATCPSGYIQPAERIGEKEGRAVMHFLFPRTTCAACSLFERCVQSKVNGRSLTTSPYEYYLRAARERQKTDEFRSLYRKRGRIEGKQAELVNHGLREPRYLGTAKRQFRNLWLAAAVNLKRLFRLTEMRQTCLVEAFDRINAQPAQLLLA